VHRQLSKLGAVPRMVGARLGSIATAEGDAIEVEITFETSPSVLYDAVVIPGGAKAADTLGKLGQAIEFAKDQYRHCKPIMALAEGSAFLSSAGIPSALASGEPDPGVLSFQRGATNESLSEFVAAMLKHRHFARAMDPPSV
jgi:catalase